MTDSRKWAIVVGSRVTWRRGSSGKLLHGVALGELAPGLWRVEVGPDEQHDTPGAVNARALAWDRMAEAARTFEQMHWLDALEGWTLERARAAAELEGRKP